MPRHEGDRADEQEQKKPSKLTVASHESLLQAASNYGPASKVVTSRRTVDCAPDEGSKLAGAPAMVGLFDTIGIGQWFRYLTGSLEVSGRLDLSF